MNIQHTFNADKGRFFIGEDGAFATELVYSQREPGIMIIEHTTVDRSLRGKGVGLQLVTAAVDYARQHQIKITPVCSFAASIFEKKPAFSDVLA